MVLNLIAASHLILLSNQTFFVYAQDDSTGIFFGGTPFSAGSNISTTIHKDSGDAPDMTVEKTISNSTLVKKGPLIIHEDPDSTVAIQIGLNNLSPGQDIYLYNGTYSISRQLNFSDDIYVHGQGNNTILDYSDIGAHDAIQMGIGSHLANVKVSGSIDPFPIDLTQKVETNNNAIIENVTISKMAYGVETSGDQNVTLTNIKCEHIQSRNDWGACIHAEGSTSDLIVRQFTIANSNRGIELEPSSKNIDIRNGYMLRIRNFNNTGHEAFSLDTHSHVGWGPTSNIRFDSIYLMDSYAPSTKVSDAEKNIDYRSDLPGNISYQNITVYNPISEWQVGGNGVTVKNSKIINATDGGGMVLYKYSKNIWIENVTSIAKAFSNQEYYPIQNLTMVNNTIIDSYNKTDPHVSLSEITGRYLVQSSILNTQTDKSIVRPKAITNLYACNNHISYPNDIPCTHYKVEQRKDILLK